MAIERHEAKGEAEIPDLEKLNVRWEGTRLVLPTTLTEEEWIRVGYLLKGLHRSLQWWLADWYIAGRDKYGEKIYQALDALDYKKHTLENWCSVARSIPPSRRRGNLDFSHHEAVAPLPAKVADEILDWAEAEEKTVQEVRQRKREYEQRQFGEPEVMQACPHCNGRGYLI